MPGELNNVDLAGDHEAGWFAKDEVVTVVFASVAGELSSHEGPNRYAVGDALVTGSTGDRWSVSRARFDARYLPVAPLCAGEDGRYRSKSIPVRAKQMGATFSVARSAGGDLLHGAAQDWLLQYAPGDFGIVEAARFTKVYRPLTPP